MKALYLLVPFAPLVASIVVGLWGPKLGRSVSHGCVRLANEDIARLYSMTKVGDEVIIY